MSTTVGHSETLIAWQKSIKGLKALDSFIPYGGDRETTVTDGGSANRVPSLIGAMVDKNTDGIDRVS
jgi:hypothetical protein